MSGNSERNPHTPAVNDFAEIARRMRELEAEAGQPACPVCDDTGWISVLGFAAVCQRCFNPKDRPAP